MRRTLLSWLLVFGLLAAGFGATVLALNNDVFSAHGFVRSYLQALERQDADEALAFAGVDVPESEVSTLLVDAALGEVGDIRLLSDVAAGDEHVVRFAYEIDGDEEITEFRVERDGTNLGLFGRWRFAVAPLARLDVTVAGDARFTANGVDAVSGLPLLVLAPGSYVIDHETELLTASSETIAATSIGDTEEVLIEVEPTSAFDDLAADAVADFLDECATQQVLMPTGCPYGFEEANRIEGLPEWSVEEYPEVSLAPGEIEGTWMASGSSGSVRIQVTVKSLFDGSTSAVDEEIGFAGSYLLAVDADDAVTVLEAQA